MAMTLNQALDEVDAVLSRAQRDSCVSSVTARIIFARLIVQKIREDMKDVVVELKVDDPSS